MTIKAEGKESLIEKVRFNGPKRYSLPMISLSKTILPPPEYVQVTRRP